MEHKELIEELRGLTGLFHEKDEALTKEVKAFGEAREETKAAMTAISERMSDIEIKLERLPIERQNAADSVDEAKAAHHLSVSAGREVTVDESRAHKTAFMQWMRKGKGQMDIDERKNLVEDATGELIVPFELEAGVYRVLPQLNVLRPLVSIRPTIRDRILARSLTELTVGWGKLETGTAIVPSSHTPAQTFIYVEDLYGLTKIGEDELMDTDVALADIVANSFGIAIANAEEAAIVNGLGHGSQQPQGISTATTGVDGTSVNVYTAGSHVPTLDDFINLEFQLKAQYAAQGEYVIARSTAAVMRTLKDADGRYLWQNGGMTTGVTERTPATFNGYPVFQSIPVQAIATGAQVGVAYFGDFSDAYLFLERLGMTLQRLNELYAESGLVGFKVHRRCGGGVLRGEAIAKMNIPA